MRILIFHGYLLRGTGSNIYNANLARTLAALGHEVHLLCQDRDWEAPEGVTVHNPDIGRVLPVYVADEYEGFDAKPFPERTDEELQVVGALLPLAPSPSDLPYSVENLRLCGCSLEQLVQNDLNDCPHCGRRLPAVER